MVLKVAIFLDDKNYRMIDEEILDGLGDDDTVIGDDEEEEGLGGDGLPKVPGEGLEEEGDLL